MTEKYTIVTSYKFVQIDNPEVMKDTLKKICIDNEVKGTILIASEGINFTISGAKSNLEIFLTKINSIKEFEDLEYKNSTEASFIPFKKMKVRLKNEIVTLKDGDLDMHKNPPGEYLNPQDWNKLISEQNVVLIDTRNSYEFAFGSFENSINPDTQSFSELPEWFEKNVDMNDKTKKIAMFCTGGIRCEKSTAYVKSLGFENVYHLKGGVLKDFEETKSAVNLWSGSLFVFDDRIALDKNLEPINQNNEN